MSNYYCEPSYSDLSGIMETMNPMDTANLRYTSSIVPAGYFEATVGMNDYMPTRPQGINGVNDAMSILALTDFIFRG